MNYTQANKKAEMAAKMVTKYTMHGKTTGKGGGMKYRENGGSSNKGGGMSYREAGTGSSRGKGMKHPEANVKGNFSSNYSQHGK